MIASDIFVVVGAACIMALVLGLSEVVMDCFADSEED